MKGIGVELTALACAAFSSVLAFGSNSKVVAPAFLLSSTMTLSASSAETLVLGSLEASATPWLLSSPAKDDSIFREL